MAEITYVRILSIAGTDRSSTIATGGTSQTLVTVAQAPNGFKVFNPDATNDLWISEFGTAAANAQGSIRIAANGGFYETPPGYTPNSIVTIVGAVTGQKITASSW